MERQYPLETISKNRGLPSSQWRAGNVAKSSVGSDISELVDSSWRIYEFALTSYRFLNLISKVNIKKPTSSSFCAVVTKMHSLFILFLKKRKSRSVERATSYLEENFGLTYTCFALLAYAYILDKLDCINPLRSSARKKCSGSCPHLSYSFAISSKTMHKEWPFS